MQELLNLITAKIDKSLKNLNISIINSCYGARNLLLKIRKEVKSIFFFYSKVRCKLKNKKKFSARNFQTIERERARESCKTSEAHKNVER